MLHVVVYCRYCGVLRQALVVAMVGQLRALIGLCKEKGINGFWYTIIGKLFEVQDIVLGGPQPCEMQPLLH